MYMHLPKKITTVPEVLFLYYSNCMRLDLSEPIKQIEGFLPHPLTGYAIAIITTYFLTLDSSCSNI